MKRRQSSSSIQKRSLEKTWLCSVYIYFCTRTTFLLIALKKAWCQNSSLPLFLSKNSHFTYAFLSAARRKKRRNKRFSGWCSGWASHSSVSSRKLWRIPNLWTLVTHRDGNWKRAFQSRSLFAFFFPSRFALSLPSLCGRKKTTTRSGCGQRTPFLCERVNK